MLFTTLLSPKCMVRLSDPRSSPTPLPTTVWESTDFTTICPAFTPEQTATPLCSFSHRFSQCRDTPKTAPPSSCATIFSLGTDMLHSLLCVFLTDLWIFAIGPFFCFSVLRNADLCNMSSESECQLIDYSSSMTSGPRMKHNSEPTGSGQKIALTSHAYLCWAAWATPLWSLR